MNILKHNFPLKRQMPTGMPYSCNFHVFIIIVLKGTIDFENAPCKKGNFLKASVIHDSHMSGRKPASSAANNKSSILSDPRQTCAFWPRQDLDKKHSFCFYRGGISSFERVLYLGMPDRAFLLGPIIPALTAFGCKSFFFLVLGMEFRVLHILASTLPLSYTARPLIYSFIIFI
jgi:hypothetical protein